LDVRRESKELDVAIAPKHDFPEVARVVEPSGGVARGASIVLPIPIALNDSCRRFDGDLGPDQAKSPAFHA